MVILKVIIKVIVNINIKDKNSNRGRNKIKIIQEVKIIVVKIIIKQ